MKINIIENVHDGFSMTQRHGKFVEWVHDESVGRTIYLENAICQSIPNGNNVVGKKYGLLLESKYINPNLIEHVKQNYISYFTNLELIFTHNDELLQLDTRFKWCPLVESWIKDKNIYSKSKLVSMISSLKNWTPGHQERLRWADKLRGKVDCFGQIGIPIHRKEEGLCDHMFSVVIENGFYKSYFTEKILDCFATGTVPIYKGCPDIGNHYNMNGIIELTDDFDISILTKELYESKRDAILDNLERVKRYDVTEDYLYHHYFSST